MFVFLLTMRSVAPVILSQTRQVFFENIILSFIALLSVGLISYSMDETTGVYGVIGMVAVLILFMILSHPDTLPHKESFENKQESNVKERAIGILNDLLTQVQSAHTGIASLPSTQGMETFKQTLEEIQKTLVNLVKESNVEAFATRKIPLNKETKEKIDSIVKSIQEEEESQNTSKEFCENEYIFQFIRYMLKVNPSAFFDQADPNGNDGESTSDANATSDSTEPESEEDKKMNETLKESKTLDVFKTRALALFNILQKRKQFGCTKSLTICCLDEVKDGVIQISDVELKNRSFSMTATQAQTLLENPSSIVSEINSSFKEISSTDKQKAIIQKIMELMTFLKMSQSKPNECTDIYVNV